MKTTKWFVKGDINGFFGLFTNSLTNIMAALGLLLIIGMPNNIVFSKIAPALVLAVGLGNLYLGVSAKRLANKYELENVTALPYGVSVPHYFIVSFGIILSVKTLLINTTNLGELETWLISWGAGASWSFIQGVVMLVGAFVGPYIQKYVPKGALLGSLAGIGLTFIAMTPAANVFTNPVVGMTTLGILMIGWLANKKLPFNIPAGFLAIVVGAILGWSMGLMNVEGLNESIKGIGVNTPAPIISYFLGGFKYLSPFLPAAIPLGIYDFLESLDNIESAHTAGEKYNTFEMLLIPALMTLITAPFGNVFPMIIYIGHPGWKLTGARVGYSIMTGLGVILLGIFGGLAILGSLIPLVALVPILIYIPTVIGKQAFGSVNKKYYPALIIGLMPFVASFMILQINTLLGNLGLTMSDVIPKTTVPLFGFSQFGASDILVSMMLISITMSVIDRDFKKASIYSLISALLAYFGFIHSSEFTFKLYLPNLTTHVFWGYIGITILFIFSYFYKKEENVLTADE